MGKSNFNKKLILVVGILSVLFLIGYKMNNNNVSKDLSKGDFVINSKNYWDFRFKTKDWQNNFGDEQTLHFYTLLLNGIPEALQEEMSTNAYSVLDFGCAQGEGTNFFAKMLSKTKLTDIDFSYEAIRIAKEKHINVSFICEDLMNSDTLSSKFDIVISSNTLEHFYKPWEVLSKLTTKATKHVIVLVPFDQPGIPNDEHFYSFNYGNIPNIINNFTLTFKKILYPDPKFWGEKQILLIYSNNANI